MTDIYETRTVTETREVKEFVGTVCDWCGSRDYYLIPINLDVNWGEEYGARWEKHACDACFSGIRDGLCTIGFAGGIVSDPDMDKVMPTETRSYDDQIAMGTYGNDDDA